MDDKPENSSGGKRLKRSFTGGMKKKNSEHVMDSEKEVPLKFMKLEDQPIILNDVEPNNPRNEDENSSNGEGRTESLDEDKTAFKEYYLRSYCSTHDGKNQFYAKDEIGNEFYLEDSQKYKSYCYKTVIQEGQEMKLEFPAHDKNGNAHYISDKGITRYPENKSSHDIIFPINNETQEEEYIPSKNGDLVYPKNSLHREFYRKDRQNNEVPLNDRYTFDFVNTVEMYPKKGNGDEFYLLDQHLAQEKAAIHHIGKEKLEYYARKNNGSQFYPRIFLKP